MTHPVSYIEALSDLAKAGKPFVSVTMVEATGSTPQDAGSKMLVDSSGRLHGTVGGGKVEHRAIEYAKEILQDSSRSRELVDWNLQRDIGMTCGGLVKLYFEVYCRDPWNIFVFGAGHVAGALVQVLCTLDCSVTCIDTRRQWIDSIDDHPRLTKYCVEDLSAEAAKTSSSDYIICMTMGHATDRPVLSTLFKNSIRPAYLGVIGSKSKRGVLERELRSEGIDAETASSFLCPIGLPIGSNQPAEIAISIAAQLLQHRDQAKNASRV